MKIPRVLFAGRTTVDLLYELDRLPEEDTKVFAQAFRSAPGGPACNAAITCALMGGDATLLSAVGGGPWSMVVRGSLERHGIRLIDLAEGTAYETPLTTVLIGQDRGTRTIVNPPVPAAPLPVLEARWCADWGAAPAVVLTAGFHLRETLPLLSACRGAGAAICLDGGSWKPHEDELTPLLDVAICSEKFAPPGAKANPETTLEWFASRGVNRVAVTCGARPILGLDHGRRFEIAIEKVEARDTNGAGDVLHGAFCYEFARGAEFETALRAASKVATRSCAGPGIACWSADAEASRSNTD